MKMADNLVITMDHLRIQRHKTAPCIFQTRKHLHSIDETKEPVDVNEENRNEPQGKSSDTEGHKEESKPECTESKETHDEEKKPPAILLQLRKKMATNTFISRTRAAVARRKRLEQPWIKGPEMRPFFHLWEQSQCTPKGRKLQRHSSLPRDYKMPAIKKASADPGIVRECCSKIRSRLKTFPFD